MKKREKRKIYQYRKGVSIIELLLVIAILVIISASIFPFLSNFILRNNFETTVDKTVSTIRKAQNYALDGKDNKTWGACFFDHTLRLFSDSCTEPSFSEDFTVPASVAVSNFSLTFSHLYGQPSSPLIITISTKIDSKIIEINRAGGISYQMESTEEIVFEAGLINGKCDQWQTADLQKTYQDPVIIVDSLNFDEDNDLTVRVKNATSDSFEFKIQAVGACEDQALVYLAMETGAFTTDAGGLIEARHYDSNKTIPNYETIDFQHSYDSPPIVFSQVMTANEETFVKTKQQNITTSSGDIAMEEEGGGSHDEETMGVFVLK